MKKISSLLLVIIINLSAKALLIKQTIKKFEFIPIDRAVQLDNKSTVGQDFDATLKYDVYTKEPPLFSPLDAPSYILPLPTEGFNYALDNNLQLINYQKEKIKEFEQLSISTSQNKEISLALKKWAKTPSAILSDYFEVYQISGRDGFGNVKFTGYYTPYVYASYKSDSTYKVPLYGRVAVQNDDTEGTSYNYPIVCYLSSFKDLQNIKLQGSGLMVFRDGSRRMLAFGGYQKGSRTPYFYWSKKSAPVGAGSVFLTPKYSVAVDNRYIPLGSVMLALVPIIDERGRFQHHEFQFLFAQDTGGAIKGTGRIDWYMGAGEEAYRKARYVSHYGKVWVLKLKD